MSPTNEELAAQVQALKDHVDAIHRSNDEMITALGLRVAALERVEQARRDQAASVGRQDYEAAAQALAKGLAVALGGAKSAEGGQGNGSCIYCGGHDYSGQGGPDGRMDSDQCPVCAPKQINALRVQLLQAEASRDAWRSSSEAADERLAAPVAPDRKIDINGRIYTIAEALAMWQKDLDESEARAKRVEALEHDLAIQRAAAGEYRDDRDRILAQRDELRVDAARWRALIGSQRLRALGAGGLGGGQGGYAHIGLEAWTKHPVVESTVRENAIAVEWLTTYVDIARGVKP